jgi:hypothetical protein
MSIRKHISSAAAVLALASGLVTAAGSTAQAEVGAPQIVEGDSGFGVYCAQYAAYYWEEPTYAVSIDGDFGPVTLRLVKDFQEQWKLHVDGQVGPDTGSDLWWVINNEVIPYRGDFQTPWGVPISHCYQVLPTHT